MWSERSLFTRSPLLDFAEVATRADGHGDLRSAVRGGVTTVRDLGDGGYFLLGRR
jgi:hypothetical protein